jgi:hypothetical protein
MSAMSIAMPAGLSGMPARMVHSALAWTSTPGIGIDEIDVTNTSFTGSVMPTSTAFPVKASDGTRPAITS